MSQLLRIETITTHHRTWQFAHESRQSLDGEDHGDKFTVYSTAAGAMFVVLGGFPTLEESEEVPRGAWQVRFGLGAHESGVCHDRVVVGAIEGVDKEVHFLAGVCRVVEVVTLEMLLLIVRRQE